MIAGRPLAATSPGLRIAKGAFQIYQKLASGGGPEELLRKADVPIFPGSWSADGRFLLYNRVDPKTGQDLWALLTVVVNWAAEAKK